MLVSRWRTVSRQLQLLRGYVLRTHRNKQNCTIFTILPEILSELFTIHSIDTVLKLKGEGGGAIIAYNGTVNVIHNP